MRSKLSIFSIFVRVHEKETHSDNATELQWLIGDQRAFGQLYARYYPLLFGIARSYLDDAASAGDVVQDVFLKLFKQRETLEVTHVKSYLFQMTKNRCMDVHRGEKPKESLGEAEEIEASELSDSHLEARQTGAKLKDLIKALSPQCRTVFLLVRFENLKYKEVAELLNISNKTVENHMGRALKALRQGMDEENKGANMGVWLFPLFASEFMQHQNLFQELLGVRA